MKQFLLSLFAAALFAISLSPAVAQVPRMFSYQGVVLDGAGHFIPDGPHNILLNLYDALGSATPIYSENQTGVVFVKGIFNVMIGSVIPIPVTVAFDKGYFLGVSIDGGAEMTPRTPLSPAPYAIHALMADELAPGATGVVTSLNTQSGAVTFQGGGGTTVTNTGSAFTISSSGGGGTGIQGVQNIDGSVSITNPNGPTATVSVANGGITSSKIAANAVGYVQIAGNAVGTAQIANGAVTPAKIDATGSTNGQVLTSNGTAVSWQNALGGGLTLPFTNTVTSASDLFSITNGGTGAAIVGVHSAVAGSTEAIRGESNSTANSAFGILGLINSAAPGVFSSGIRGKNNGTGSSGIGVYGSQAGSGWGVYGEVPDGIAVNGFATNNGTGVSGTSTKGTAGSFTISTASNTNNAIFATTSGTGSAGYFEATNTSPSHAALEVKTAGTTFSTLGIYSSITSSTPGPNNIAAAIKGAHLGTTTIGTGVWGRHAGTGTGVLGSVDGNGGYGVAGTAFGANSTAMIATYSGGTATGIDLELNNGYIKVSGVNRSAFVHTTSALNNDALNPNSTVLAYAGMAMTDMVIVTHVFQNARFNNGYGVWWNPLQGWEIFLENNPAGVMPNGEKFNVLVIKQ